MIAGPRAAIEESEEPQGLPLLQDGVGRARPAAPGRLRAWLYCLRVKQWVKNLFLFAALLFTLDQSHPLQDWLRAFWGFSLFCLLSASVYIFNDIVDAERDRLHPLKRYRPIAAGLIDPRLAACLGAVLTGASLTGAFLLNEPFGRIASLYFLLTLAYSWRLKQIVIVDLLTIAAGFVLRAAAGAIAVGVPISAWLLVCTTLLALFLGLAKRRSELRTLGAGAGEHRKILEEYSPEMLDQMITVVMASTLMAYALYTFNSPTAAGHLSLMITIPFVIYGLFRYLYLVHKKNAGGSIASDLLEDRPLLINMLLWAAACAIILRAAL